MDYEHESERSPNSAAFTRQSQLGGGFGLAEPPCRLSMFKMALKLVAGAGFEPAIPPGGIMSLDHGAKPDVKMSDGTTPLMLAAEEGCLDLLALLLEHGANISAHAQSGRSALSIAVLTKHWLAAEALLEKGADNPYCKYPGGTSYEHLKIYIQTGGTRLFLLLKIFKVAYLSIPKTFSDTV